MTNIHGIRRRKRKRLFADRTSKQTTNWPWIIRKVQMKDRKLSNDVTYIPAQVQQDYRHLLRLLLLLDMPLHIVCLFFFLRRLFSARCMRARTESVNNGKLYKEMWSEDRAAQKDIDWATKKVLWLEIKNTFRAYALQINDTCCRWQHQQSTRSWKNRANGQRARKIVSITGNHCYIYSLSIVQCASTLQWDKH